MTISLKRSKLSKPKKGERINHYDLAYVRARNKNKAHSILLELFQESGVSKSDLAKMLGKKPEQITRWLSGPGNMTLDTISDLVFAINGNFIAVDCRDELGKAKSNKRRPDWVAHNDEPNRGTIYQHVHANDSNSVTITVGEPQKEEEYRHEIGRAPTRHTTAETFKVAELRASAHRFY